MFLLPNSSTLLRAITDSAAPVDVVANWADRISSTDNGGATLTAISSATTTTIVPAPGASTIRNIRTLFIRNKSNSLSVTITIQVFDGTTAFEIDKRVLAPGGSFQFVDGQGFFQQTSGGAAEVLTCIGAQGDGSPGDLMEHVQRASNVAPTPTNIGTSTARCSLFRPRADIVINRIRGYGVGATTGIYQVAIYRYSDLARLTAQLAINTAANAWFSAGAALNVTLLANTNYFIACSVNATGTTAGITAFGGTLAATTGQVQTPPDSLPGGLAPSAGQLRAYFFQFAVTAGALPNPAATPASQSNWTGGMPAFWLDNADV